MIVQVTLIVTTFTVVLCVYESLTVLFDHAVSPMDCVVLFTILMFKSCDRELRRCENVTIKDDDIVEQNESFNVTLGKTPGWNDRITLTTVNRMIQIADTDDGYCTTTIVQVLQVSKDTKQSVSCSMNNKLPSHQVNNFGIVSSHLNKKNWDSNPGPCDYHLSTCIAGGRGGYDVNDIRTDFILG